VAARARRTAHPAFGPADAALLVCGGEGVAESIGQSYAELHGLSVIAGRLGWCPRPDQEREFAGLACAKDVYFSPGDVGRFFHAAVKAPLSIRFAAVNATSRPLSVTHFDLSLTKELLGWEPRDQWPTGLPAGWAK